MDFFAQQDQARRNARYLTILFALAVLLLVVLLYALLTAGLWLMRDYNVYAGGSGWEGYLRLLSWQQFAWVALAVGSTVGLVSLVRWLQLAGGGKQVAEGMGGRRVLRQSTDPYERRCLNIVDELSLAAGMPVPALYLLPEERGINAFAAGTTPGDAIVAVTRGTLLQLNREELSGVIGHELSHILNGDMRLGIRLAALLKGITFLGDVGHLLLRFGAYGGRRSSRDRGESAALPLVGLALLVLGWLGSLAAGAIKAAISRQKEYLADASAVQFTRSNAGIANALKVIGGFVPGSLVHAARASEMSHLFFSEVQHHIWDGFATHPPLEQRIRRLDREWDGEYIQRAERVYGTEPIDALQREAGVNREALVLAAMASAAAGTQPDAPVAPGTDTGYDAARAPARDIVEAPGDAGSLEDLVTEPLGAETVALGLLLTSGHAPLDDAIALLRDNGPRGQADLLLAVLPRLRDLAPGQRFPLIARAIPALKSLSTPQYRQFKNNLVALIRLDQQTELFEWCLFQLLRHYLDPEFLRVEHSRPKHRSLGKLRGPLRTVLSVLAYQGSGDGERAFDLARESLELPGLKIQPLQECNIADFSRAVHTLADAYPLLKPRILKSMALAAADDGQICAVERELITAVAAVMDCPLPTELAP